MADRSIEKSCWACKTVKPLTDFPKNRSKPDGHGTECKNCRRTQDANYHLRNREKHLAQFKKYREAKPEYFQEYGRKYYKANKKEFLAKCRARYQKHAKQILARQKQTRDANLETFRQLEREWYWRNPERMRANRKRYYKNHSKEHNQKVTQWQRANPDKVREYKQKWIKNNPDKRRVAIHNNTKMRRGAKGRFTLEQLIDKYEFHGWRCYLCRIPLTLKTSHPDHRKPLSRGGMNWIANIAPACIRCNLTKNRRTESEFRALMAA